MKSSTAHTNELSSTMSQTVTAEIDDDVISEISLLLNLRRAINMSMYKDNYVKRRIAIRIRATASKSPIQYCHTLRSSEEELDLLVKALTIHVSQFYRNSSMFEILRNQTLPYIFKNASKNRQDPLSILSLGCASGEEPYSLAIIIKEYFNREIRQTRTTITGLDIDSASISRGIEAEYTDDRIRDLPDNLKERYFREHGGKYRLVQSIKDMVTFQIANIADLPPYPPTKLVLCRNTLIYFARSDQEKILRNITEILQTGGILVLGRSETIVGSARQCFETVNMEERIYRKK